MLEAIATSQLIQYFNHQEEGPICSIFCSRKEYILGSRSPKSGRLSSKFKRENKIFDQIPNKTKVKMFSIQNSVNFHSAQSLSCQICPDEKNTCSLNHKETLLHFHHKNAHITEE